MLAQPGTPNIAPEIKAELVLAAYDYLQSAVGETVAKRAIDGMLRAFAESGKTRST